MHIPLPSFERTMLLIIFLFVATTYIGLMPRCLTKTDIDPVLVQVSQALKTLDTRITALEPPKTEVKK